MYPNSQIQTLKPSPQVRAQAELELRRRRKASLSTSPFEQYRFDPAAYIEDKLGWRAWQGSGKSKPGQVEILDAIVLAVQQQIKRQQYQNGEITADNLFPYDPDAPIKNRIRVESAGNLGKSKVSSGVISWFFDCFAGSVIYTFAPVFAHMRRTLWKEIMTDRQHGGLPHSVMDSCVIKDLANPDHFAQAIATSNDLGSGKDRIHGQHAPFFLAVIDEAEGVQDYVFDALDNLTSGGVSIVLMIGNPRTTISRFHKETNRSDVASFRMSAMDHPNVVAGREVIPNAVTRQSIEAQVERHCSKVDAHNEDTYTFELAWSPGQIYQPDDDCLSQVFGIPSSGISERSLISPGRYEAACKREPIPRDAHKASMGVDCARWGLDKGTLYTCWNGRVWRNKEIGKLDQVEYYQLVKKEALLLKDKGVTHLQIRVDAGGGFGSGLIDLLKCDDKLIKGFAEFRVIEVAFGGGAVDEKAFYDTITELTADVAESLKSLAIINPPESLEADLCERKCEPRNKGGFFVKKLEEKDIFRKQMRRSPDDGDGFVLAVAGEHLFVPQGWSEWA